jgi:hypothetical protein
VARAAGLAAITVLMLGTLSRPAAAQQTRYTDLWPIPPGYVYMDTVPYVSGGDADLEAVPGSYTDVSVQTGSPYVYPGGLEGYIAVLFEVREGKGDHTVLRRVEIVRFKAPPGWRIGSVLATRWPLNFTRRYYGSEYGVVHRYSEELVGTYCTFLQFQTDQRDRDDQGNTWMAASISIPVELVRI